MPRNKEADKVAKEGTILLTPIDTTYTLASLKRITKTKAYQVINNLWAIIVPMNYNNLLIKYNLKLDKLYLDQASLGCILVARSYYRDFIDYYYYFYYYDTIFYYSCRQRKSLLHFYFCPKSNTHKSLYKGYLLEAIPWLLRTIKGSTRLVNQLMASKFYQTVCPLYSRDKLDY